jgi:hypothetical protein
VVGFCPRSGRLEAGSGVSPRPDSRPTHTLLSRPLRGCVLLPFSLRLAAWLTKQTPRGAAPTPRARRRAWVRGKKPPHPPRAAYSGLRPIPPGVKGWVLAILTRSVLRASPFRSARLPGCSAPALRAPLTPCFTVGGSLAAWRPQTLMLVNLPRALQLF